MVVFSLDLDISNVLPRSNHEAVFLRINSSSGILEDICERWEESLDVERDGLGEFWRLIEVPAV